MKLFAGALPALLLLALLCLAPTAARAQSCWVNGNANVAFGTVGPEGGDATGTVSFTCQRPFLQAAAYRVCLFLPEGSPIAGINPRWMTNYNGAQMRYDLYSDPARTRVIGPYGSSFPLYSATMSLTTAFVYEQSGTLQVYGRVTPGQSLPAGNYQSQLNGGQLRYSYNIGSLLFPPSPPSEEQCRSGTGTSGSGVVSLYTGVTASFANTCMIQTATDLEFGSVDALEGATHDQTSTIQLQCPTGTVWRVGLDNGRNASGTTRRMSRPGGGFVVYELYRDSARSQRWGNTLGTDTSNGVGTNGMQSLTVYGRVPPQETPAVGDYSDTVTVTLTY